MVNKADAICRWYTETDITTNGKIDLDLDPNDSLSMLHKGRLYTTAAAVATFPNGLTVHFPLTASASSANRRVEELHPEAVDFEDAEGTSPEELIEAVGALNGTLDDTDLDAPEYELCFQSGEQAGETETDAAEAERRLDAGKPVRVRFHLGNADKVLPDGTGGI